MNFPLKKYFVKKESWKRFGVKAGVTLVVLWAAGAAFASRYRIGIDPQQEKCLPGYTFFLIDLNDQTLERERFTPSKPRTCSLSTRTGLAWSKSSPVCRG
ncbi:hypothetical protein ABVN75_01015 [Escherichia coli]